ncbi:MAG: hydroxyethylthiazole kinase [Thermovirgaceae bacterium]|nr:hydroxyethylthiazole kinase [Thermovirgaceae bacterium]
MWSALAKQRPLVYHLTNSVAMNFQAQIAVAMGASPLMSLCPSEVEDLAKTADAVLINIGTPTPDSETVFAMAIRAAGSVNRPVLLDPVGYGATHFRTQLVDRLLQEGHVALVKGNAAEISLLSGQEASVRGVDAGYAPDPGKAVFDVARSWNCIAIATGPIDWVSDGERIWSVQGGHPYLASFSGSGCALGTIVAAIVAASRLPLEGALTALLAYRIAAETAALESRGPGTFPSALIDALHCLTQQGFPPVGERVREIIL